jgi:ribosome-associated translation inhibitor RaiA
MFTEEMYLKIKEITDSRDIGISDFIRDAVQQKLDKEKRPSKKEIIS